MPQRATGQWDRALLGVVGVALCVSIALPRWALHGDDPGDTDYITTLHRMHATWVWSAWSICLFVVGVSSCLMAVAVPKRFVAVSSWVIGCCGLAIAGGVLVWANVAPHAVTVVPGAGSWLALTAGAAAMVWSWVRTVHTRAPEHHLDEAPGSQPLSPPV